MSSSNHPRRWMDLRIDPSTNTITEEFTNGINVFITFACQQPSYHATGVILCPCARCKNEKPPTKPRVVARHLYTVGFKGNYYVWSNHGESFMITGESSTATQFHGSANQERYHHPHVAVQETFHEGFVDVADISEMQDQQYSEEGEVPAFVDKSYEAFMEANQPLYEGCNAENTKLYLASCILRWKTEHNLSVGAIDDIASTIKRILPGPNTAPESYYETKKITKTLGLPVHKIDVCENNCMLFWRGEDATLEQCRFCQTDRYHPWNGKGKKIPKQRMFYLPITDRLKRLYQCQSTAGHMRWHAEHMNVEGEMNHPSDGAAWKHFQSVYPGFASEPRNIYLGLSTDGFNPLGMSGEAHSIWPVIVTPYNLPPGMCMNREFLFLSILVPGPTHPKKSLDVYLQPLIDELQQLWTHGADVYDISTHNSFKMKAALMWTISDFPAYGMLSGWMTHGRLACPNCMDSTNSFWLTNGRKQCWFDCHRKFLKSDHPYRRNVVAFTKSIAVHAEAPVWRSGKTILDSINSIEGLQMSVECGGNGHNEPSKTVHGYGQLHNWYKKSIFWSLPYWENLLLRHNLDFMHIEKKFFDNIIKTILNVPGKTKDNIKSRLDMAIICNRRALELISPTIAPVPIFRMSKEAKKKFLSWLKKQIRFPDGYASNFGRCVNEINWTLSGLKSHDCHVIMERLLPFALMELLPKSVHVAISEIALFFRDIGAPSLKEQDVLTLKENIAVKLCNLEKIFPPSFFDVMEHLPVHLPDEAMLGGPVQYRWMYPFERYMYHLKKKVRNKAQIGGSIVEHCVQEEISALATHWLGKPIARGNEGWHGENIYFYAFDDVPTMFKQKGRFIGKHSTGWITDEEYNVLQTFLMNNCPELAPYERMFEDFIRTTYPALSATDLQSFKDNNFARWCKDYVNNQRMVATVPQWLFDFVQGPRRAYTSWPSYATRGFLFRTLSRSANKKTQNSGVCVRGTTDTEYYGVVDDIRLVEYDGGVGLKVVIFKCFWYDTTSGSGMRRSRSGLVDVAANKQYRQYDPFITPEQCDQVCYIPYPKVSRRHGTEWLACVKVVPRGVRNVTEALQQAFQEDGRNTIVAPSGLLRVEALNVEDMDNYDDLPDQPTNDMYTSDHELTDNECSEADSSSEDE